MIHRRVMRCAPSRTRVMSTAAEVATLFDWLSLTQPARVAQIMRNTSRTSATSEASLHYSDIPHAVEQLARNEPWSATQQRVWGEAVVLLTRSGCGTQALAALQCLPAGAQPLVLQEARLRGLPHAVCTEWRAQLGLERADDAAVDMLGASPPPVALNPPHTRTTSRSDGSTARQSSAPALSVKELSTNELIQRAFALHRPRGGAPTAAEETVGAVAEQQATLFRELASRGRYKELVQCIIHWQQKKMLPEHPAATAANVGSRPATTDAPVASSAAFFDGLHALKAAFFPSAPSASGHTSTVGSRVAREHLLTRQPVLFARCARDTHVAERLLRLDGPEAIREGVRYLLTAIRDETSAERRGATLPVLRAPAPHALTENALALDTAAPQPLWDRDKAAIVAADTLWRGVAMLSRLLQPSFRRDRNAHKQALLTALASAAEHTAFSLHACHGPVTNKTVAAVRSTVESLCSSLLHTEAQVRFVGLPAFASLTESLEVLAPALGPPNALAQCLLLCLAAPAQVPPAAAARANGGPSAAQAYLYASPNVRWAEALRLLQQARQASHFVVTSAHLRALLGGLQSVSIVKTWQQALACTDVCVRQWGLVPDASSLSRLLLNWKQCSWQDAFRVLEYTSPMAGSVEAKSGHTSTSSSSEERRAANTGGPPASLLRDLQLVAVKHASWVVTLSLMQRLLDLERHAAAASSPVVVVGFMNRVYCLYAAAAGGQLSATLDYFDSLAEAPQYRNDPTQRTHNVHRGLATADDALLESPFNVVTVAVGAMAFLDHNHFSQCSEYGLRLLERDGGDDEVNRTHSSRRGGDHATPPARAFRLTATGREAAAAAVLLGFALSGALDELVGWLNALAVGRVTAACGPLSSLPPTELPPLPKVLERSMALQGMRGLQHLSAPVRLVFDTLAAGRYESCDDTKSYETRQRGTNAQRRALYIPPRHYRSQVRALVQVLAEAVIVSPTLTDSVDASSGAGHSDTLSPEAAQQLAESVAAAGFGPEFLSVTLLREDGE